MAEKKFTLIGRKVTDAEALNFGDAIRFDNTKTAEWVGPKPEDILQDDSLHP